MGKVEIRADDDSCGTGGPIPFPPVQFLEPWNIELLHDEAICHLFSLFTQGTIKSGSIIAQL